MTNRRTLAGLSLVEMILAVSLVGLIVLFLLGLLPSSGFLVRQAEHQVSATNYAEEIMAELGSLPFEVLKRGVGTLTPENPGVLGNRLEERKLLDSTLLRPEVIIASVDPPNRLIQASVTIRWSTGQRNPSFRLVRRFSSVLR